MKNVLIFLGGVLVGALGTVIYIKKKVIPDMRDELERNQDYSEYYTYTVDTEDGNESEEEPKAISAAKAGWKNQAKEETTDYTNYSKDPQKKPAEEVRKNDPPAAGAEVPSSEPYVIDPSEFDIHSNFEAHQYVMYADGVVIDDDTEEILDAKPEDVFGRTAMEELKKEDIVYVRDEAKKKDYCIELRDIPFDGTDYAEDEWGS